MIVGNLVLHEEGYFKHRLMVCSSYSLYEPKDIVLRDFKGGLENAILKNRTLLRSVK